MGIDPRLTEQQQALHRTMVLSHDHVVSDTFSYVTVNKNMLGVDK